MNQKANNHWWNQSWLPALLLVAAVIFSYQPVWHAGFIWDDNDYVTDNPLLSAPDGLWRVWFSTDSPSQYFPLVYTTFWLEHALWGLNAAGYHWVNILMHAGNALLVWRLLSRLKISGAWLGAAFFALHPVQVESVAWITELKNVQSMAFFLLALLAWDEFVEERPAWRWYVLALVFHALALFSKTTACTLPAALILVLWLKGKPINLLRWIQMIPFVALGVAMGFVSMWWERHHQGTVGDVYTLGWLDRLLVASRAVWFYAGKLLWPVNLTFNYPLWTIQAAAPLAYVGLVAGASAGAAIYFARRFVGRSVEVAAVFFVATLSPMLGFVMMYTFKYTFVADHYQYVAMLGPVALAAEGMSTALNSFAKKSAFLKPVVYGVLVSVLCVLTWRQSRMYENLETLWRMTIERNPDSYMGHNNLGAIFLGQGKVDDAVASFERALVIRPNHGNAHGNLANALRMKGRTEEAILHFRKAVEIEPQEGKAHSDLGYGLLQIGRVDEAIAEAQKAVELQPNAAEAHGVLGQALSAGGRVDEALAHFKIVLAMLPRSIDAHYALAVALFQCGRIDQALPYFQTVADLQPENIEAQNNLGWAQLQVGRTDDAIARFQMVLKLQQSFVMARGNLAIAYLRKGQAREAIVHYQAFLKVQPDAVPVLTDLAWLLATSSDALIRNGAQAVELAQRANKLSNGQEALVLRALAAAYAESGKFAEAVATARLALERADATSNAPLSDSLRIQLDLYQTGAPFRDFTAANAPATPNQP